MRIYYSWHTYYVDNKEFGTNYGIFNLLNARPSDAACKDVFLKVSPALNIAGKFYIQFIGKKTFKFYLPVFSISIINYSFELMVNFFSILLFKPDLAFAADPLSGILPAFFKKIGYLKNFYYINPDFSEKNKKQTIYENIYFLLDKICTFGCDKNICCSSEVVKYKKNIYKITEEEKFFLFPNFPNPEQIQPLATKSKVKNRLIYVGSLDHDCDFETMFDQIHIAKTYLSNLSLYVVGSGNKLNNLKKYVIKKNYKEVFFLGYLNHDDTLREIAKSEIGLAIYGGKMKYDRFRDSCKIREYQSLSTLPITTSIPISNVSEINKNKTGLVVSEIEMLSNAIKQILLNRKDYIEIRDNLKKTISRIPSQYHDAKKMLFDK